MSVKIGISPSLQPFTNNIASVEVNGSTIGECLTLWLDCAVTPQKGGLRAAAFARAPYFTITGAPESKTGRFSEVGNGGFFSYTFPLPGEGTQSIKRNG